MRMCSKLKLTRRMVALGCNDGGSRKKQQLNPIVDLLALNT